MVAFGAFFDQMFGSFLEMIDGEKFATRSQKVEKEIRKCNLVSDIDVNSARLDHVDRVVRIADLE